jgi:hypothetical protein
MNYFKLLLSQQKLGSFLENKVIQNSDSTVCWNRNHLLLKISLKNQNLMQILGQQGQHQAKGLTLKKVKICLVKKPRKIIVF